MKDHLEQATEALRAFVGPNPYHSGVTIEKTLVDALAKQTDRRMMGKQIDFHVPGAVVGKMRARIGKVGNHSRMFTPEKMVSYENLVKYHAYNEMGAHGLAMTPFIGPLQVNLLIGVQIPASWSKKKQAQALAGQIFPTSKPDLDNSIKSVFDAMNGVVYRDDAQVVTTVTKKRYREAPGLWVTVFQINPTDQPKDDR